MENKYPELEWPNRRIPAGGVLHYPRAQYSPEVHHIMKVIMDESKLTLSQRRQVDWCLRTGSALSEIKQPATRQKSANINLNVCKFKLSRRRPLTAILESGDFEREKYQPLNKKYDREKIKEEFQNVMEFGEVKPVKIKLDTVKSEPRLPSTDEMIIELISQIKDRSDWLRDMEALGEGAKHREVIHDQIEERLRRIAALKPIEGLGKLSMENIKVYEKSKDEVDELSDRLSRCSTSRSTKSSTKSTISKVEKKRKISSDSSREENIRDILSIKSAFV